MKTIKLPCYGIVVELTPDKPIEGKYEGGNIKSSLKDGEIDEAHRRYEAACDGIESLVLAAAVAGVDIETPAFLEAIETAVESVTNHFF